VSNGDPRVLEVKISAEGFDYLQRIFHLGVVFGTPGNMTVNPKVKELIQAIHQVLAGGAVDITITLPGNADLVEELNKRLDVGCEQTSAINRQAGHILAAPV
jgi:hypothetical protein